MIKQEAAALLAGVTQTENKQALAPTNLHVISGEVYEASESGLVNIAIDGTVLSDDGTQWIEVDTLGGLEVGDTATILLTGESGKGMTPLAIGSVGSIDRITVRIAAIEADYIKVEQLEATEARIESLEADHVSINDLTAATARIGTIEADYLKTADMTAEQARVGTLLADKADVTDLTAATARIGELEADHVSVEDFEAEQANIDSLQAATADIATIRANSAKVQNLTAAQLEADHATIGSLDTNYARVNLANVDNAWIENGTVKDGAITNAMINSVSANKLTAGTIDASEITVTNLNADNITTGTINGQRIGEGSLSLSKLEDDVYTEAEVDSKLATMQAEIDGAIETWTGTDVPTLNNSPASDWTTADERDRHVGDVYFVVNSQSQQNGYNYRFTKTGSTYSWQLIKDNDVTNALQRLTTAEGKITTFDSDISTLKTDTGELKTKTQSLETSLGDKVDVTTFNELSSDVEENSASITTLSNTVSQKADSSTVTTLSNTVNTVQQTASTNSSKISQLVTTLGTNADGTTKDGDVVHRTSAIEQDLSGFKTTVSETYATKTAVDGKADASDVTALAGRVTTAESNITQNATDIALRATKTEAAQMAQPNLTPFFSIAKDDVYNASTNPTGYWKRITTSTQFTTYEMQVEHNGSEGWAHFAGNATSGSPFVRFEPVYKAIKPSTTYTFLAEVDGTFNNSSYVRLAFYSGTNQADAIDPFSTSLLIDVKDGGTFYRTGKTRADVSASTVLCRAYLQVYGTGTFDCYIRISLYEGEYSGPYKPYSGTQLYASQAELKVQSDRIGMVVSNADATGSLELTAEALEYVGDHLTVKGSDGTTTVISGGQVQTGSIKAADLNVSNINASNSLTIGALSTDTQDDILNSNVVVGGRNLLRGSFSGVGWKNYTTLEDGVFTRSTTATSETYILSGNGTDGSALYLMLDLDTTYTLSCWAKSNGYVRSMDMYCYDQSTKNIRTRTGIALTTEWVKYEFTFATPTTWDNGSNPTGFICRFDNNGSTASGTEAILYVKWPKLERGNKATDWTPAPEDTDAAISDAQDTASTALAQGVWYATCTTAAATTAKVATTTNDGFELTAGATVNVRFSYANSGAVASLTLNVNSTGAKNIKYAKNADSLANLPAVEYIMANRVHRFTYDGTYWVMDLNYDTNNTDRKLHNTAIYCLTAVASGKLACATSAGYIPIAASAAFDLSYPILYASGAWTAGSTYTNGYEAMPNVTFTTTGTITSAAAYKQLWLKGTVSGNTFTCASSGFLTCALPTSDDGSCYLPLGVLKSTTQGYFTSPTTLYAYRDGAFGPVSIREASAAAKTATSYVTDITGGGIMVHPSGDQTTGVQVTNDVDILRSGSSVINIGTDDAVRVGTSSGYHVSIDSDSLDMVDSSHTITTFVSDVTSVDDGTSAGTTTTTEIIVEPNPDYDRETSSSEVSQGAGYLRADSTSLTSKSDASVKTYENVVQLRASSNSVNQDTGFCFSTAIMLVNSGTDGAFTVDSKIAMSADNLQLSTIGGNGGTGTGQTFSMSDVIKMLTTETVSLTRGSAAASWTNGQIRRCGKIVVVTINAVKLASALASGSTSGTITTIPNGYRPNVVQRVSACIGSSGNYGNAWFAIGSSGIVQLANRSSIQISTSVDISCNVIYIID